MAFSESSLVIPKTEPKTDLVPSDDFLISNVKQEPITYDEHPAIYSQTARENTNPEVKEESYHLEIFEEPEFKYDLTNSIRLHCEER